MLSNVDKASIDSEYDDELEEFEELAFIITSANRNCQVDPALQIFGLQFRTIELLVRIIKGGIRTEHAKSSEYAQRLVQT